MSDPSRQSLNELTREECLDLLASRNVGRIGGSVEFLPFIFPVNYRMYREKVLIRTVSGTKLDAALTGQIVAFEADDFTADGISGWSVLVRGGAEELTDPEELAKAELVPVSNFAFNEQPTRIMLISTVGISGRSYDHS